MDLSGIVLAGGRSSRFGSDKAFATLGGRTLLEIAAANLAPLCGELVVVTAFGRDPAPYALGGGARVTSDEVEGAGPLAGIVAGLRAARAPRAAVVAVDMPCLDARVLALLARLAEEKDAAVVVPVVGGRPEPLHAVWATRALAPLAAALARGVRKISDAWPGLAVHRVEEAALRAIDPELRTVWNVNRPDELERIRALLEGGAGP